MSGRPQQISFPAHHAPTSHQNGCSESAKRNREADQHIQHISTSVCVFCVYSLHNTEHSHHLPSSSRSHAACITWFAIMDALDGGYTILYMREIHGKRITLHDGSLTAWLRAHLIIAALLLCLTLFLFQRVLVCLALALPPPGFIPTNERSAHACACQHEHIVLLPCRRRRPALRLSD